MYATCSHKTKQKTLQIGIDKTNTAKEKECMQFKILKNIVRPN